jgi:hypothetical protein
MIKIPQAGIFTHDHVISNHYTGQPYLYNKSGGVIDGIGRQHVNLYGRCDICDAEILVAKLHVNSNGQIYNLSKK